MKYIKTFLLAHLSLFTLLGILLFASIPNALNGQRKFPITFKGGKKTTVIFKDEDPKNIPDWNLTWRFINANIVDNKTNEASSEVEALVGPVAFDFDFQYFLPNRKGWLNTRLISMPDTRYAENNSDELKKKYLSAELNYAHQLYAYDFLKKRKMNITDNSVRWTQADKPVKQVYQFKPEVKSRRSLGIRGGITWLQQSFDSELTKYSDMDYRIYSGDKTILNIGFSSTKIRNLEYTTTNDRPGFKSFSKSKFGAQKTFFMSGTYIDLLYTPMISLYGTTTGFSGQLPSEDLLAIKNLGFRIGGYRKVSKIRLNLASFYFYEIGWFPSALKDFRVTVGYGFSFGPFKKSKI